MFFVLYFSLCWLILIKSNQYSFDIVQTIDDVYAMYWNEDNLMRIIPDHITIQYLGFDIKNLTKLNHKITSEKYNIGKPVKSLAYKDMGPDDRVRVKITKILESSNYPTFWLTTYELPLIFNPTFVKWHGKILISWRTILSDVYLPDSDIRLAWMYHNFDGINTNLEYLGLGYNLNNTGKSANYAWDREDPRLFVLPDNRLLITYAIYTGRHPNGIFQQIFFYGYLNNITNIVEFTESKKLHLVQKNMHQKNWIPFINANNSELYFIESLYPLHIVKLDYTLGQKSDEQLAVTVIKYPSTMELPWLGEYGWPPRLVIHYIHCFSESNYYFLLEFHHNSR